MTVATLIAAVRRRTGLASTDPFATDTDLIEILSEANNAIGTEHRWPWLEQTRTFATAAGVASYATATRWVETKELRIDTYRPMRLGSKVDLDTGWPDAATTGVPVAFAISSDAIHLRPIPNAVYTVTEVYYQHEADFTASSDTPLMPVWAQAALTWHAAAVLFRRTRQDLRANEAEREADKWLRRLHDNARRTTGSVRPRIRPGGFI